MTHLLEAYCGHQQIVRLAGRVLNILTCLLVVVSAVEAQAVEAPIYRIRAGDTLSISVAGHAEWSMQVSVRPDGRITYPATGEIEVAGRTLQELAEQIEYALGPGGRHLRAPNVFINVTGMRTSVAHILGAVARAGAVELPTGMTTATKLLTMAGGAVPESDLRGVRMYGEDGSSTIIDLQAQLEGEAEQTVVRAGDVLMVPEIEVHFVGALGAVGRTGEVPLARRQTSIDMLDLLVKIGGIGAGADPNRALILRRDGEIDGVALNKVLTREIEAPRLYGGDVLWVPPSPEQRYFAVTGAVRSAGRFEYREGMTLADALALAGELSEAADPRRLTIIHADGEKEVLDILPMVHGRDPDIALKPVQPDDIILVPSRDESYVVLGAVRSPGFYSWDEGIRLADALAKAGGPHEGIAEMSDVVLVRRSEDGGSPTVLTLDARQLLQGENEGANWPLRSGDTVYVPTKDQKDWRDSLSMPLSILGIITTLERVFRRW